MKYFVAFFMMSILFSCKTPLECDSSGIKTSKSMALPDFDTVEVNVGIDLKIEDSDQNFINITADKDVIQNITFEIINRKLILTNHNKCVIQNKDAEAEIFLKVDDIQKIIANTDLKISSANTWHFNYLDLLSENYNEGTNNIADFDVKLDVQQLNIIANGNSNIKITGTCQDMFVGFYGGNPRLEANNLDADNISVFQRSNADMWLRPLQKIAGDLFGYGDIYLYHRPPIINIIKHDTGHIYFVN